MATENKKKVQEEQEAQEVSTYTIENLAELQGITATSSALYSLLHDTTNQIIANIGTWEQMRENTRRAEDVFAANYEEQYNAGDLSFLVDAPEGITDNPPELLPAIERELETYKTEKGLAELPLRSLLFDTDQDSGRAILDVIIERAGGKPPIGTAEEQEQERGAGELPIPNLHPVVPKYYTMPNTKLTDNMSDLINAGLVGLRISSKKKKEIITPVNVTMINEDGIKIKGNRTEFDRQVMNAIISIYLDGSTNGGFTSESVLRVMNNRKNGRLNPQTVGAVTKSIEKQRIMHADCDMSEVKTTELDNIGAMLLVLYDGIAKIGGVKQPGYWLSQKPIELEYAELIGNQLITVPANLLDIQPVNDSRTELLGGSLSSSKERIAIRGYLLRRVANIKYDNEQAKDALRSYRKRQAAAIKKGNHLPSKHLTDYRKEQDRILYDSVFKAAGVAGKSAQTLFNYKEYIRLCLDNWTIKNYIAGYRIINGRRKDSEIAVDILLK